MPQRFLRPGIRTSERWNKAGFFAQSLYVGILTLVDDFGRYDGRARLLHGECFSLRDDVKPHQTAAALKELSSCGLIQLYGIEGKEYLQVLQWQERSRSEQSKFPDPPEQSAAGPQESASSLAIVPRHKPSSPFIVPVTASAALKGKFERWMAVRREQGKAPKDWTGLFADQFEWLGKYSEPEQLGILEKSIINRYQGLIAPTNNGTHSKPITKGSSRTYGTANERRLGQYANVGKV